MRRSERWVLGAGLLTADPQITAALVDFSDAAPAAADGTTPADIIASFARLHGLLDLAWTDDAERLDEQLTKAADELVLDSPTAAAHLMAERAGAVVTDQTLSQGQRREGPICGAEYVVTSTETERAPPLPRVSHRSPLVGRPVPG